MMETVDGWLTTQEAADLTGYHLEHIRRLIRAGEIEAKKWGKISWMVNRQSLIDYFEMAQQSSDRRHGPKTN